MVAQKPIAQMTAAEKALLASFYGFGRHFLGLPILDATEEKKVGECKDSESGEVFYEVVTNDRQKRVLDSLDRGGKTSVRTCNGAGKTTMLIPTAVLGFMAFYPRAKVVVTSGVERQVRAQVFPALRACERQLKGWVFTDNEVRAPNGSVALGFATNDGSRFEGWHGNKNPFYDLLQHDGPLLIVVDEAKSVKQQIYDAIDRCTYQSLLLTSSCGGSSGEFYDSQTKHAKLWQTHQIAARHCPHADHEKNVELIRKRGLDDRLVRSKVFAEFMGGVEGACIQRAWVERCLTNPPPFQPGARRLFCDFAAGGDENVMAECIGNRVRIVAAWREKNTMQAIGQFIDQFRKLGIGQDAVTQLVSGDEGGMGKVLLDRMAEIGWVLQRVNNGAAATEKAHYRNKGAEMWFEAAKKFELGRVMLDGADETTVSQLSERLGFTPSDGRREVESKEDMRERGIGSPDRADAIVGALMEPRQTEPIPFAGGRDDFSHRLSWLEQARQEADSELAGANAG